MAFIFKFIIAGLFLIAIAGFFVSAQTYNCDAYGDGSKRKIGDLDGNKIIDINDSRIFFEFMVNNSIIPGDKGCLDADANGIVDFEDNRILNEHIDEGTELGLYTPNLEVPIVEEEEPKESESGGRRRNKANNTSNSNNTGIINIVEIVNKINEIKEDSPVIFWSIISILSIFILAISVILIVLLGKMIRNRNSSAESQLESHYFTMDGSN